MFRKGTTDLIERDGTLDKTGLIKDVTSTQPTGSTMPGG